MKTLMTDFGFQSDVVDNGKKAIRKLAQRAAAKDRNYDLIMMDLQMPEMNGFEAAAHIRNELGLNTPIVAITSDISEEAVEKCMNVGMNDYISKPVDEMLLFQKIVNVLKVPSNPKAATRSASREAQFRTPVYTNLDYLTKRARGDPDLTREMIGIYLEQTPKLLSTIRESMTNKDWERLRAATHKIIPSFAIMGFDQRFQEMAKELQGFDGNPGNTVEMDQILLELEFACNRAFRELNEELKKMTNN
jgi:CheY-like chemotaxis protein